MYELLSSISSFQLAVAFIVASAGLLVRKLTTPSPLQSIPKVPFWDNVRILFQQCTFEDYAKKCNYFIDEPVQRIFMGDTWMILMSKPEHSKLLHGDIDLFPKIDPGDLNQLTLSFFGQNVGFVNGDLWRKYRRAITPAFQKLFPTAVMRQVTHELIEKWDPLVDASKPIELYEWMQKVSMDILGLGVFNYSFDTVKGGHSKAMEDYHECLRGIFDLKYMAFGFLDGRWNPFRRHFFEAGDRLNQFFMDIVVQRRKELEERLAKEAAGQVEQQKKEKDLITLMLESFYGNASETMTDKEIQAQMSIFFNAGHDTTAVALMSNMCYLALNPEAQRKAREEVLELLPTDEHLEPKTKLPYLEAVINESLRLHPSVDMTIFRKITKDIQLTGKNNTVHNVKAGSATIALEITAMHRNPDLWSDPLEFKPERWLDNKAKPGFVAFGAGARICPGMNLSLLEQRVVLSMLLRRYEWSLPIDSPHQNGVKASGFFFAKPDPMYMHIRRVQPR